MNAKSYSNTSMLDMIFEHRNKAYGAYVLRTEYNHSLRTAMASILSVVTLLCFGNYIRENMHPNQPHKNTFPTVVTTTDLQHKIVEPAKKVKPPLAQHPPAPRPAQTQTDPEKRVVTNDKAPDSLPAPVRADIESGLHTNNTAPATGLGVTDGTGKEAVFAAAKQAEPVSAQVYNFVEEMPQFPGGDDALRRYISRTTEYPQMERDNGIGGKVLTQFTVNEDGTISDIVILKSPSPGFNREVTRVIKGLPVFKPGKQQSKAVKVRFVLPFTFNLN